MIIPKESSLPRDLNLGCKRKKNHLLLYQNLLSQEDLQDGVLSFNRHPHSLPSSNLQPPAQLLGDNQQIQHFTKDTKKLENPSTPIFKQSQPETSPGKIWSNTWNLCLMNKPRRNTLQEKDKKIKKGKKDVAWVPIMTTSARKPSNWWIWPISLKEESLRKKILQLLAIWQFFPSTCQCKSNHPTIWFQNWKRFPKNSPKMEWDFSIFEKLSFNKDWRNLMKKLQRTQDLPCLLSSTNKDKPLSKGSSKKLPTMIC